GPDFSGILVADFTGIAHGPVFAVTGAVNRESFQFLIQYFPAHRFANEASAIAFFRIVSGQQADTLFTGNAQVNFPNAADEGFIDWRIPNFSAIGIAPDDFQGFSGHFFALKHKPIEHVLMSDAGRLDHDDSHLARKIWVLDQRNTQIGIVFAPVIFAETDDIEPVPGV